MGSEQVPLIVEWQRLIRDAPMPPAVKNVVGWLRTYANADGTSIYPGVEKLMLATGLSRGTTVRALAALREAGLLVRTKRGGGRGSRKSDEYRAGMPAERDPGRLGELVTAAYESTQQTRKREAEGPYESAEQTRNSETEGPYESTLQLYEFTEWTPPASTSHKNTTGARRPSVLTEGSPLRLPARGNPAGPDHHASRRTADRAPHFGAPDAERTTTGSSARASGGGGLTALATVTDISQANGHRESELLAGCSFCGAGAGHPCTNSGTGQSRSPHQARLTARESNYRQEERISR